MSSGDVHTLTVEVPPTSGGDVFIRLDRYPRTRVEPEALARIRMVYAEAIATALQDRGTW